MKKKNYVKLILIVLLLFISTGCVKYNATMNIKKDKSMNFNMIYALDTSLFGNEQSILEDKDIKKLKEEGYSVKKYEKGKMKGFEISIDVPNIDKVSSADAKKYDLSGILKNSKKNTKIFKLKKGWFSNTYIANFKFDSSESNVSEEIEENNKDDSATEDNNESSTNNATTDNSNGASGFNWNYDYNSSDDDSYEDYSDSDSTTSWDWNYEEDDSIDSSTSDFDTSSSSDNYTTDNSGMSSKNNDYTVKKLTNEEESDNNDWSDLISKSTSSLDLSFNVNLPYSAISNNATSVNNDQKELKWELTSDEVNSIKFEFKLYNKINIIITIVVGIILMVGITTVIVILIKKKKGTNQKL